MRSVLILVVVMMAAWLGGCSSFDKDFAQVQAQPVGAPGSLAGAWSGEWQSDKGHGKGALKAVITPAEAPSTVTGSTPQKFDARFYATWAEVLNGEYTVPMTGVPGPEGMQFSGSKDLGPMYGGLYHYRGYIKGDTFYSTYKSSGDSGTFTMKRVSQRK